MAETGARPEPENGFRFLVVIDGLEPLTNVVSVSGPASIFDIIEYRTGSDPTATPRQIPGLHHLPPIILKAGLTADLSLYKWHKEWVDGTRARRGVVIRLLDRALKPVLEFRLADAWPVKWAAPTLNAESNEVVIQTLELAYERLDVQPVG
jgi:phage tail-like protein